MEEERKVVNSSETYGVPVHIRTEIRAGENGSEGQLDWTARQQRVNTLESSSYGRRAGGLYLV